MVDQLKPRDWNVKSALVAPEWRWFWEDTNQGLVALIYGPGARNIITGEVDDLSSGVSKAGFLGPALDIDANSAHALRYGDNVGNPANTDITLFAVVEFDTTPNCSLISAKVIALQIDTNELTLLKGGVDTISSGITLVTGAPLFLACSYDHADGALIFVVKNLSTGIVEIATATNTAGFTAGDAAFIGATNQSSAPMDGRIHLGGYLLNAFSREQLLQWADNPFGPFTPLDETHLLVSIGGFVELDAAITASATLTTTLAAAKKLDGLIASTGSLASALDAAQGLTATIAATSALAATLDAQSGLVATIAATGDLVVALDAAQGLSATVAGVGAVVSALDAQPGLTAAIAAVGDIAAELLLGDFVDLDAVIAGVGAFLATLDAQPGMESTIAGTGVVAADISLLFAGLDALVNATGDVVSELNRQVILDGAIAATATIAVAMDSQPGLDALIAAIGSLDAEINTVVNIDGNILASSTVQGTVSLLRSLDSLITGTSTVGGELNRLAGFTVVIAGISTITGELTGDAADVRGFVFPANAEQAHTIVDNAAQAHAIVDNQFPNP